MDNLSLFTAQQCKDLSQKRKGEVRFFKNIEIPSSKKSVTEILKKSKARFIIFGIQEDIGVQANHGRAGCLQTWSYVLKQLLHIQDNKYIKASNCMILGHLEYPDLYKTIDTKQLSYKQKIKYLRTLVEKIDQDVGQLVYAIISSGKTPIFIGGGHNNAYGAIKGTALAKKSKINVINIDAHSDLRAVEGRHSGNGFSYAIEDGFLDRYYILGLHENYTSDTILNRLDSENNLGYTTFESIKIQKMISVKNAAKTAQHFTESSPFGLEVDCDAIKNVNSSAMTPSGFSIEDTRSMVAYFGKHTHAQYLHICEAAMTNDEEQNKLTSKMITYLLTDFIKSKVRSSI